MSQMTTGSPFAPTISVVIHSVPTGVGAASGSVVELGVVVCAMELEVDDGTV